MASLTFYNLPQEKKNRIVKAAVKEFSRVPLEKALISNIIKDADIPRGSFYQYFENIDDLFVYILDIISKSVNNEFFEIVKNKDNDFFETMKNKFYEVICYFENGENKQFNINVLTSIINIELKQTALSEKINALKLRSNSDLIPEEIKRIPNSTQIIGLIEMASMSCLNKFVFKGTSKKEIYEEYSSYLDYIKEIAIKKYKKNE